MGIETYMHLLHKHISIYYEFAATENIIERNGYVTEVSIINSDNRIRIDYIDDDGAIRKLMPELDDVKCVKLTILDWDWKKAIPKEKEEVEDETEDRFGLIDMEE